MIDNMLLVLVVIGYIVHEIEFDSPSYNYEVVALHQCCHQQGNWTLHGVWPEFNDGQWPSYCRTGDPLDIEQIQPLLARLDSDWPDCYCSQGQTCLGLWSHEWSKHGTCSRFFPDQYKYFLGGLERYNDLSSRGWLEKCPNRKENNCYFYWDPWNERWIDDGVDGYS